MGKREYTLGKRESTMGKQESTMGKRETTMGKREYTFADGSRPRMGKRDPVEETDSSDRGKKHYC